MNFDDKNELLCFDYCVGDVFCWVCGVMWICIGRRSEISVGIISWVIIVCFYSVFGVDDFAAVRFNWVWRLNCIVCVVYLLLWLEWCNAVDG